MVRVGVYSKPQGLESIAHILTSVLMFISKPVEYFHSLSKFDSV